MNQPLAVALAETVTVHKRRCRSDRVGAYRDGATGDANARQDAVGLCLDIGHRASMVIPTRAPS